MNLWKIKSLIDKTINIQNYRDENPWVTVDSNGAVRVKKKWDYEELGREKTIDFWVIITNSGSGGKPLSP